MGGHSAPAIGEDDNRVCRENDVPFVNFVDPQGCMTAEARWPGVFVKKADPLVLAVIEKMVKQRKDSIAQFDAAAREDLAQVEREEMAVIETYLPEKLGEAQILGLSLIHTPSPRDLSTSRMPSSA